MDNTAIQYLRENIKIALEAAREQERKIVEHLNALERIDEYLAPWVEAEADNDQDK